MITDTDFDHLHRSVELATDALKKGNSPYGSVLVGADGTVLFEDHNHDGDGDNTRHPEFEIARWAAENLKSEERKHAVVYTSTEHCPMCAGAHAWVGLGSVVYASSSRQVAGWYQAWGAMTSPVAKLPLTDIAPGVTAKGPAPEFEEALYNLHHWYFLSTRP